MPASAGLDSFYVQGCSVGGFWVVAGQPVDPEALRRAANFVVTVFTFDPELAQTITNSGIRLGIIGLEQQLTDMPEYRTLYEEFPEVDWNNRARGLGATPEHPLVSVGEENLLCLAQDWYLGEDILLHEFAHVIHQQGLSQMDNTFDARLDASYQEAQENGLWLDTYSTENAVEYWAEGVQSYFGRNLFRAIPDGVHGPLWDRDALEQNDLRLFLLIQEKLGDLELPGSCQVFGPQ